MLTKSINLSLIYSSFSIVNSSRTVKTNPALSGIVACECTIYKAKPDEKKGVIF